MFYKAITEKTETDRGHEVERGQCSNQSLLNILNPRGHHHSRARVHEMPSQGEWPQLVPLQEQLLHLPDAALQVGPL